MKDYLSNPKTKTILYITGIVAAVVFAALMLNSLGIFDNSDAVRVEKMQAQQEKTMALLQKATAEAREANAKADSVQRQLEAYQAKTKKEIYNLNRRYESLTNELDAVDAALPERPTL